MKRVSDLELERFLTDDLDDDDRARVAAAVAADADLKSVVAERRAEQRAFFILHPRAPAPKPAPTTSWLSSLRLSLSPLAAAAAVAAVFFVVQQPPDQPPDPPRGDDDVGVRLRGGALPARLLVRRQTPGGGEVVFAHKGEPLRADDAVRIEVELRAPARCSVLGVDARGDRALHYDRVVVAKGTQVLPEALVLDDSTGPEELWVVCDPDLEHPVVVDADNNDADNHDAASSSDPVAIARRAPRATIAVLPFFKEPSPR